MGLHSTDISLIPLPAKLKVKTGTFLLTPHTCMHVTPPTSGVMKVAHFLNEKLCRATGYNIGFINGDIKNPKYPCISLILDDSHTSKSKEFYMLTVKPLSVVLRAPTICGLFRGAQTLRQLFPPEIENSESGKQRQEWTLPCVVIEDYPAFSWRGLLLDCCRHFMTKDFIKHLLDVLAYYKISRFHWHLTEDQGWRIEIKQYPRLTEIGAWRNEGGKRSGGYFSQDDVKEIITYASERYIEVVPEIEMPGHCTAALAAYPDYSCSGGPFDVAITWGIFEDVYCVGNEDTFTFLQNILTEVAALFPFPYIHIGADEVPKRRWKDCYKCQKLMREKGFEREEQLQSYFINRIVRFLAALGKKAIGWDELLDGDPIDNITIQYWRTWKKSNTLLRTGKEGKDIIVSPTSNCYLDYELDKIDLATVYSLEPVPREFSRKAANHILGGECNMWTEYAPQDSVESKLFPRLLALAEVLWSAPKKRDTDNFYDRVKEHYKRLEKMGVRYGKAFENEGDRVDNTAL
jgi:hexosaminidase